MTKGRKNIRPFFVIFKLFIIILFIFCIFTITKNQKRMSASGNNQNQKKPIPVFPAIILLIFAVIMLLLHLGINQEEVVKNTYYFISLALGITALVWIIILGSHNTNKKIVNNDVKKKIEHPEVLQEFVSCFEYNIITKSFIISSEQSFSIPGKKKDEYPLHEFLDLIEEKETFKQSLKKIILEKIPFSLEFQVISDEDKVKIFSLQGRVFLDNTGEPETVSGLIQDITVFKDPQRNLLEHKKRLERTQQLAQIAFFDYNWAKQQVNMSSEMNNILNLQDNVQDNNYSIRDKIFPEDIMKLKRHAFMPANGNLLRKGEVEFRAVSSNGELKYIYAQYEHSYNELGHRISSSGWLQDVTSHRIDKIALAESEEKYRNMFALESDALFLCDNDTGEILETNAAATKMFGYSPSEFLNITVFQMVQDPENIKENLKRHNALFNNIYLITKTNDTFPAMISLAYFIWKDRNVHLAAIRDVSKIRKAEEELELTKFTLDHSALMVYVLKKDGSFHYINEALFQNLGYEKQELLNLKIYDIEDQLTEDDFTSRWERLKKEKTIHVTKNHITKEGEIIPCEMATNFLFASGGEYKVAFVQDVRKRNELEEQVRHSEKMNAVGQLAGGIAHDFNNQLMGISGYANMLRERLSDAQLINYADNIIRASERSADLTGKLLAFSRKGKYVTVINNIHEIIGECVMLLKPGLGKQIEIVVKQQAQNPFFMGDTSSIQNAILNIAINAKDAMESGGIITISTRNIEIPTGEEMTNNPPAGKYLSIEIADNGIGIQKEHLEKIFEPFFSTKEKGHGTGLGLSATLGTIQAHHGTITVNSSHGRGTTFTILLPSCHKYKSDTRSSHYDTVYGEGIIMLVDDEEIVREVTSLMIKDLGYRVVEFDNGKDCISYYKENGKEVAAVILDIMMPDMTGYEVFRELKAHNKEVKVLLFSGFSPNNEVQKAMEQGAAGYLHKPARKDTLSQQLAKIAGKTNYYNRQTSIAEEENFSTIEGLNFELALQRVEGDVTILIQVIENVISKYGNIADRLEQQAETSDKEGLYLNIHSLKSILGTIGAVELSNKAQQLEDILEKGNSDTIHKNKLFNDFICEFTELLHLLKERKEKNKNQDTAHSSGIIIRKPENIKGSLEIIINLIQQFSPSQIDEINELCRQVSWPQNLKPSVSEMLEHLDDFDFEKAGNICKKINTEINKDI